jgi:hypothetical protein
LSLPSRCNSQRAPSRCALFFPGELAVFLSTTYFHITSTTGWFGFTLAMLLTANAYALRFNFVRIYCSVSFYNLPLNHLHNKFVLSLPSHC